MTCPGEPNEDWSGEWVKVNGIDMWVGSAPDEPELEDLLWPPGQNHDLKETS